MKIGVAIPTYGKDVMLLNRCLRSIEKQTKLPSIVAISASSCKKEDIFIDKYSFPVKIIFTSEVQNASTNRNKAAQLLLENENVDIISFFDSDDEMYPERLGFIEKAFLETQNDFVVHNFHIVRSYRQPVSVNNMECKIFTGCILPNPNFMGIHIVRHACPNAFPHLDTNLTHGHVSVTSKIWKEEQFREETEYVLWEDSEYCNRLTYKYRGGYIQNILSKYHQYNETFNDYYNMILDCITKKFYEECTILLRFAYVIANEKEKKLLKTVTEKRIEVLYGIEEKYLNVTDICYMKLVQDNILRIPAGDLNRSKFFGDPLVNILKHIKIGNKIYTHEQEIVLKLLRM